MKQNASAVFLLLALLSVASSLQAQTVHSLKENAASIQSSQVSHSIVNINNLWLKIQNDGRTGYDTLLGKGLSYPLQYGNLLYTDNLIWVGKVNDGQLPLVRVGGGRYGAGAVPGGILSKGVAEDPRSSAVRVYRIRADYRTADLTLDAAIQFGVDSARVTSDMVAAVRAQYDKDWKEWPWQKGAPFEDRNKNGVMDADEVPGLQAADQVAWFSCNDLDDSLSRSFAGTPPIGMEIQLTLWAYKNIPVLQDMIFKRYRLIYKGTNLTSPTAFIDSMYLSQFSDPEIEHAGEDLAGCDSALSLVFVYKSDLNHYGGINPGLAYQILQGPLVQGSATDEGLFDFIGQPGKKNLPLSACVFHLPGADGQLPGPNPNPYFYWNVLRGMRDLSAGTIGSISSTPWLDWDYKPTKFMYSGDPVNGTGWLCTMGPLPGQKIDQTRGGDVTVYISSGPYAMTLGSEQELVLALMACPEGGGVSRVPYLKYMAQTLRGIWPSLGEYVSDYRGITNAEEGSLAPGEFALNQNFPNPFNPSTHIRYTIPHETHIKLVIFDLLGREVKVLEEGNQKAGDHLVSWDASDARGVSVPTGVYFYRLVADQFQLTRKLLLLR